MNAFLVFGGADMVGNVVFQFFFFQAEDGIRDVAVTGVQTCVFRSEPLEKRSRGGDPDAGATLDLVGRALAALREGKPARLIARKDDEEKAFRMLGLLTSKPVLYVCNVDEEHAA